MLVSPWSKQNFIEHLTLDQASFDRITGSILDMFDFDDPPNLRRVIFNDMTGEVVHGF